jgi:hypothetical protein
LIKLLWWKKSLFNVFFIIWVKSILNFISYIWIYTALIWCVVDLNNSIFLFILDLLSSWCGCLIFVLPNFESVGSTSISFLINDSSIRTWDILSVISWRLEANLVSLPSCRMHSDIDKLLWVLWFFILLLWGLWTFFTLISIWNTDIRLLLSWSCALLYIRLALERVKLFNISSLFWYILFLKLLHSLVALVIRWTVD